MLGYLKLNKQQGRIQDFKLGGAHLKNLRRTEGGGKIFGVFVWKITILRQKIIFFPIAKGGAKMFGVFRVKNHDFTPKNHIFSNFRVGARRVRPPPPWIRPWVGRMLLYKHCHQLSYSPQQYTVYCLKHSMILCLKTEQKHVEKCDT